MINNKLHRKYIYILFSFFNIYYTIIFFCNGKLGGDFRWDYTLNNKYTILISCLCILLTFVFFNYVFIFISKIKIKRSLNKSNLVLDYFFVFLSIFNFILTFKYGSSLSGVTSDVGATPKVVFYFVSFFQPTYLILIYLFYKIKSKEFSFYLVTVFFIFSFLLLGQTGSLLKILFLLILRQYLIKNIPFSKYKLFIFTIFGLVVYPVVRFFKLVLIRMHSGLYDDFNGAIHEYISEFGTIYNTYFYFLNSSFERFQSVANLAYIMDLRVDLSNYIYFHGFTLPYENFWLINAIASRFSMDNLPTLQANLAFYINGSDTWSSQAPFLGFLILTPNHFISIFLFSLTLLLIATFLSKIITNQHDGLVELTWYSMFLLLCHGWVVGFANYTQALFVFLCLVLFCKLISYRRKV